MSSNNQNNPNRRLNFSNNHQKDGNSTTIPIIYEPELMDAEDSLLEIRSSLSNRGDKNGNMTEKLVDTDFYKDFGDLFDPDVKIKN